MSKRNASKSDRLKEYHQKRDFSSSPEPSGKKSAPRSRRSSRPLKFCVQKHLASHLHYDFRLEHDGALLSWAVPKGPSLNPRDKRLAMKVEDHPLDYGDFEGVIPEGYGAGIVMLWDHGAWKPEADDVSAALDAGELKFTLEGVKLKGSWVLVRTRGPGRSDPARSWLLIKHRDEWAGNIDVTAAAPLSVKSFGDFDDILAADNPEIWESHRPAKSGAAGKMLADIIRRAARKKAGQEASPRSSSERRTSARKKSGKKRKNPMERGVPKNVAITLFRSGGGSRPGN
jgi:bifunctional non-homologous end joining protein LigD